MVHDIIPEYYKKIGEITTKQDIDNTVEEAFTEGTDWRLQKRHASLKTVTKNFKKFEHDRVKEKRGLPTFTEKRLEAKLFPDLPMFEGIIDAYWEDGGGLWIDWKTGKYEEMDDSRKVQGKVYELLLKANDYPVEKGQFVNLARDVTLTLPRVSSAWLETKVRTLLEARTHRKTKSPLCEGWCEYRLSCDLEDKSLWEGVLYL